MYEEQLYYNNTDEKVKPGRTHCETLNVSGLPTWISYIRHYALDVACAAPPGPQETTQMFKNRLYGVLLTMATDGNGTSELRIARKYAGTA